MAGRELTHWVGLDGGFEPVADAQVVDVFVLERIADGPGFAAEVAHDDNIHKTERIARGRYDMDAVGNVHLLREVDATRGDDDRASNVVEKRRVNIEEHAVELVGRDRGVNGLGDEKPPNVDRVAAG